MKLYTLYKKGELMFITWLAGFVMDHWLLCGLIGGLFTSAGAVGASGAAAKRSTEDFLAKKEAEQKAKRKEAGESK